MLVSCPQLLRDLESFRDRFEARAITLVAPAVTQQLTEAELLGLVGGIDGMIAGDDQITRAVLEHAPRLRVISKWGIGTDAIDLAAAREFGIRVTNTPGVFSEDVADVVIGYLVLLSRRIHEADREVRAGRWTKPLGVSLSDRVMGVVGLGNIGAAVSRRAIAMRMRVLGTDISGESASLAASIGVQIATLDRLLSVADVVSLNCPLTEITHHLLDARRLDEMKPGAWVINTARGGLIDEMALAERLQSGHIGAAALDVFEVEPLPDTSPLRDLPNVVFGSHNSSNTAEGSRRASYQAIANLFVGLDEVRR